MSQAPVAVVGCGGLGVPAAVTLVLAGIQRLRLIDVDAVELSNLHRQVLYRQVDIGGAKTGNLRAALGRIVVEAGLAAPAIETITEHVTTATIGPLLDGCSAVFEGTDDASAKFLVNDWAVDSGRLAVIAAAIGRRGQWMVVGEGRACYRCIFEEPPPPELLSTCQIAGVLGPVVGQVGALAARDLVAALRSPTRRAAVRGDGRLVRRTPQGFAVTPVGPAPDCRCAAARSVH